MIRSSLLAFLLLSAVAAAPAPTVLNPGFLEDRNDDGNPDHLQFEKYRGAPRWQLVEGEAPGGAASLEVACDTIEDIGGASQTISTSAGSPYYRVAVQLRTTAGTRASVACASYRDDQWLSATYEVVPATDTREWTVLAGYYKPAPRANKLRVTLWCNFEGGKPGSAWFAGLEVRAVDELPPVRYEPISPEPTLAPADETRGFALFDWNYLSVLCREFNPLPAARLESLETFASRGEFEPVTFGVYAARELHDWQVKVGELRGPGRATIPSAEVAVTYVRYLPRRTHLTRNDRMFLPCFLDTQAPVIAAKEVGQAWLTVHVPDKAPGGFYRGEVTVTAGDAAVVVPLTLRVFPYTLREPADKWFGMYDGVGRPGRATSLLDRFRDMRRHGLTTVAYTGPLGAVEAASTEVPKVAGSTLERVALAYGQAGFPAPMLWVMTDDVRRRALEAADRDPEAETSAEAYRAVIRRVLKRAKEKAWPKLYFAPATDAFRCPEGFDSSARLLTLLRDANASTALAGLNRDETLAAKARPLVDLVIYEHGPFKYRGRLYPREEWQSLVDQLHADGKHLLYQNFDSTACHPEATRFGNGFLVAATGADGMLNWAYSWARDPYGRVTGVAGEGQFVYPKAGDERGGPSLGYEGIREGLDDYKYWYTLKVLLNEAAKETPATRAGKALLGRLFDDLDLSRLRTGMSLQGDWTFRGRNSAGDEVCRGEYRLPLGWAFETYHEKRLQLAEALSALLDTP